MTSTILHGNCLDVLKTLPDNSVHMAVTSPPYWGLRAYGTEGQVWPNPDGTPLCQGGCEWEHLQHVRNNDKTAGEKQRTNIGAIGRDEPIHTGSCSRCGAWRGELGHEPTPQLYVAHIVAIMREVRRVLRDDGTLWLNLGDSYAGGKGASSQAWSTEHQERDTLQKAQHQIAGKGETRALDDRAMLAAAGLKPKDLVGIPWRVAFALQDDGWWLRQDIIWAKPNPMPESVTDRCTKSHEYMFLLAKSARYYYDAEAVKEAVSGTSGGGTVSSMNGKVGMTQTGGKESSSLGKKWESPSRNRRSVWTITTKPFKDAHFATFPPDLVEPCIKAGTSQHGVCATCGAPWERVMQRTDIVLASAKGSRFDTGKTGVNGNGRTQQGERHESVTAGWRPTCTCNADFIPATVLDPFNGAGTTGVVAKSLGRGYVGIELNPAYVEMAQRRIDNTQAPLPGTL